MQNEPILEEEIDNLHGINSNEDVENTIVEKLLYLKRELIDFLSQNSKDEKMVKFIFDYFRLKRNPNKLLKSLTKTMIGPRTKENHFQQMQALISLLLVEIILTTAFILKPNSVHLRAANFVKKWVKF